MNFIAEEFWAKNTSLWISRTNTNVGNLTFKIVPDCKPLTTRKYEPDIIAEINEIKNYNSNKGGNKMNNTNPHIDIVNYTYTSVDKYDNKGNITTYMKTTLSFKDGTETSVLCPADKADKYYGFYACYAKHIAGGNKINDEAEYWIEILPKKLEKEYQAELISVKEEQRIIERDKKRREKKRVRMEAIRRKEAYDAAKLANEKYGIPMEFTYKNKD